VETDLAIYFTLFWNAFIAATLLPALSEVTLASLVAASVGKPIFLFAAATTGNVAGSALNWWLGFRLADFRHRKWFPFSEEHISRASRHFNHYGTWSLLFAWLPIVGDPLTLVAGMFKTRFSLFLVLVTVGKAVRYGVIILIISKTQS